MSASKEPKTEAAVVASRMSFGDHLDELRRRVIRSLLGLLLATILCFHYGDVIIGFLTAPYSVAMEELGFDPRMVQLNPTESFMEYFKISMKFGIVLATPWMLIQIWRFVATGLYPSEQRLLKAFAPASVGLFVVGASFMVIMVLAGLMRFLIGMSMWFPMPDADNALYQFLSKDPTTQVATTQATVPPLSVPVVGVDPVDPADGQLWFNIHTRRLSLHHLEETYFVRLDKSSATQFVQPFFSISEYLGFVVNLSLAFGLGFQIPIVVVFLISLHIIGSAQMAAARKYVILCVAILAAVLTPSPDVATMMMLAVPMALLFEIGLLIGRLIERRQSEANDASEPRP
jgi:sec-independent protein translocase protein TatC